VTSMDAMFSSADATVLNCDVDDSGREWLICDDNHSFIAVNMFECDR